MLERSPLPLNVLSNLWTQGGEPAKPLPARHCQVHRSHCHPQSTGLMINYLPQTGRLCHQWFPLLEQSKRPPLRLNGFLLRVAIPLLWEERTPLSGGPALRAGFRRRRHLCLEPLPDVPPHVWQILKGAHALDLVKGIGEDWSPSLLAAAPPWVC